MVTTKTCFICEAQYQDEDGVGEQSHYAFKHGLTALELVNERNPIDQWAVVIAQGSRHTSHMWFGDVIEPAGSEQEQCMDRIGHWNHCKAKTSRGYYCAQHGSLTFREGG